MSECPAPTESARSSGCPVWSGEIRADVERDAGGGGDLELALRVQRDLAVALVGCDSPRDCLRELLEVALRLPGYDGGGTYLVDDGSGDLILTCHRGLSDEFVKRVECYPREAVQSMLVRRGRVFFGGLDELPPAMAGVVREEGLKSVAVLPLLCAGEVKGSLNLASRRTSEITREGRFALESIAALARNAFALAMERQTALEMERRMTLALDGLNLGVWRADLATRRFYASARARELHGVPLEEELTVELAKEVFHPDDLPEFLANVMESMVEGGRFSLEYRITDGSRWIGVEAGYYCDPSPRFIGVVRDITRRKVMEADLRASGKRLEAMVEQRTGELARTRAELERQSGMLRLVLDGAGAGMREVDFVTNTVVLDERGCELMGYPEGTAVDFDRVLTERIHPVCGVGIRRRLAELVAHGGGVEWDHEFRIFHPERGIRWINSRGTLKWVDGSAVGLTGVILDITERKRAAGILRDWSRALEDQVAERTAAIRDSEGRFRMLAEASQEGVVISQNGVVVDANAQIAALLGYGVAEMIGRPVFDFIPPEERGRVTERIRRGENAPYESLLMRRNGETVPVGCHARTVLRDGSPARVTVLRDLTDLRRRLRDLEDLRIDLENSRGLALASEINSGILQELDGPLAALDAGMTEVAARLTCCPDCPRDAVEIAEDIMADLGRMRDIVVHLGQLADPSPLCLQWISLNSVVLKVLPLLRSESDERAIVFETDLSGLPEIRADAVQIKQAVLILARNACEACCEAGRVPGRVAIRTRVVSGSEVELSVCDNGTGLSEEVLGRLFTPFFSTKPSGTGIGLRLCQTISRAHGGSVSASNNPEGGGACFVLRLPINHESA